MNNTTRLPKLDVVASILFGISLMLSLSVQGQSKIPLLERIISVSIVDERLDHALHIISDRGGFSFSYNPNAIEGSKTVNLNIQNKSVREVLDLLFKGTMQYKERSKYIILTKSEATSSKTENKTFTGYVIDESTGEKLKNVSIYDPNSLTSTVTNAYGFFQIEIEKPTGDDVVLAVNKLNYTDTLMFVASHEKRLLNIPIKINKDKIETISDSVREKLRRFWLVAKRATEQAINMENIRDSLNRKVQFSLLPFVGTNGKLSGNVINDYSFNLFGGYSRGVNRLELGGLFNSVGGDVKGAQFAGLFNGVAGRRWGFQMAGLINTIGDSSKGAQFAGLFNINLHSSSGFASAGLANVTVHGSRGVKLAGLTNFTLGHQDGIHLAGLFNFTTKNSGPAQVAGLYNFTAGETKGAQVAGLFNFTAKAVQGVQVSPLLNFTAKTIRGAQVGGLINFASQVQGTQVGVFNVSDSIKGIPVGILSFVMKGYHKIEIAADEIFYTNVAFRTGVTQFYNIFNAGLKPSTLGGNNTIWSFGYGVGTAPKINNKLSLNIDLTSNQVVNKKVDKINLLNKLYIGADIRARKHFSFIVGATLNGHLTKTNTEYPNLFTDYNPSIITSTKLGNDLDLRMWLGAKVGVRFL